MNCQKCNEEKPSAECVEKICNSCYIDIILTKMVNERLKMIKKRRENLGKYGWYFDQ